MVGSFGGDTTTEKQVERKDIIVQSLWTKPITDVRKLRDTLWIAALSLEYAHRNGYKVHMHTDKYGASLLKGYGYEKLATTLEDIPATVPTELFAAGKYYAMKAEGIGKAHIDIDVYLKKPYLLDKFYTDRRVDVVCQMDEDMPLVHHEEKIKAMHVLGYPAYTRPCWQGSMNTGVIGFNNAVLAGKYMDNYRDALEMYTQEKFDAYKKENPKADMHFDFVLEQINLSYMSVGYNVWTLLPTKQPVEVCDKIGYQHLQGQSKWTANSLIQTKSWLNKLNGKLYQYVLKTTHAIK